MKIWLPSIRARSGADVYVERLAAALRERDVEPVVQWFPHAWQYAPWRLRLAPPPAGTDIINANSWNAFAFRRASIPLVATMHHCVVGHGYPEWKSRAQAIFHSLMVRRFERASFRAADAVVAVSDSTRTDVCHDYGLGAEVHVIANWVDTAVFSPAPSARHAAHGRTRILIVGNLSRRKGGDLIVPFCNALGDRFDVTVVAGLRGDMPRVAADGAGLRFVHGLSIDQLVEAYRESDIVVSLSRHEGFGYTALEGMACAKPVVAFSVAGLRDVIADGETGLLGAPNDVAALAASCRALRDNPTRSAALGAAGRIRATTVFNKRHALDAHLQLYAMLIARHDIRGESQTI